MKVVYEDREKRIDFELKEQKRLLNSLCCIKINYLIESHLNRNIFMVCENICGRLERCLARITSV